MASLKPMLWATVAVATGQLVLGCSATLRSELLSNSPPAKLKGVPWVEPRVYEVFVYQQTKKGADAPLVYYARHALTDKVNDLPLKDHRIWVINPDPKITQPPRAWTTRP
jgi:hypothetical protein